MAGSDRIRAAREKAAKRMFNRGYGAGMREWKSGSRTKAPVYGPDTPQKSYPTNNPRSNYGEYVRGREFAKQHLRTGIGPASAGQSMSSSRPLAFGDAPSQEARMYGGGKFGFNKFPGRR
jgi:hypothetical protein